MDALDLTTGERLQSLKTFVKGNRRKASAPQRRHMTMGSDNNEENQGDIDEKTPNENSDPEKVDDDQDNTSSRVSTPKSDPTDVSFPKVILGREGPSHAPTSLDSPGSLQDDASLRMDPSKMLRQRGILTFGQGQKYLFNINNNSNGLTNESASVASAGDTDENKSASYKSGPVNNLSHSLLLPFSGSVDDLMQQRLRRYLDDVQPAEAPGIPERTKKQNRWAFNVWREWARKRNMLEDSFTGLYKGVPLDVGQANEEELDYWLCKFVMEIRRKDGNPYPPHTLMQIVMGIQRYLRQQAGKPTICILDRSNPTYSGFRSVLDYRIKELASNGTTAMKSIPRASLLEEHEGKLDKLVKEELPTFANNFGKKDHWKNGVMGTESAQALLNAVFYHNYKTFDIQYIDDHWNLRAENFSVHIDNEQDGRKYLEFTPSVSSMMVATAKASGAQVTPKRIDAEPHNDQSVFSIYEKYLSLIPKFGPFYRHPVDPTIVDRSIKFSDQWVGKNRLRAMLKHLIDTGNGFGRHRTIPFPINGHSSPSMHGYGPPLIQLPRQGSDMPSTSLHDKLGIIKPLPTISNNCTIDSKHRYSPNHPESESAPPSPKRSRLDEPQSRTSADQRNRSPCITFDGEVLETSEKSVANDKLEIAVPASIKSVTILKGSRKITIQLD